ncbi:MAG: hypothetical protein ACLS61_05400 [Ruminococcus sp.]
MEQKILQYEGPVRNEEIVLKVASYAYGNQLLCWNDETRRGRGVIW